MSNVEQGITNVEGTFFVLSLFMIPSSIFLSDIYFYTPLFSSNTMDTHQQHNTPPDKNSLKVIPLGGVEEIGMNMTVFSCGDDMILVDAGLMFPDDSMPGIDYVIPDYSYILDNREMLKGIIITHGHEDHTGALPFLLKEIGDVCPIYATSLTLGLIKEKLKEHKLDNIVLNRIKPRDIVNLGSFTVEFIRVTHSIVDGVGLAIITPLGNIIHTGDFKLDPTPVDGDLMDFLRFSEYGERGVLLMLSDSTNAEKGGFTFSEKEVRRAFEDIFSNSLGRIIIATFSSNIHRIQQAIDVAALYGKKVILCGRSIESNARIALDTGYLKIPPDTWVGLDEIDALKPEDTVIITTGSQGEPMSVLSRIAVGEHKQIKAVKGDTVIISAKMIPGNEKAIGRIINHLFRRGADVIYEKVSEIHVSGHASKEELKLLLNIVRPKYFMPVHGEYRHLIYHAKLAYKMSIPEENVFIMDNGDVLEITDERAAVVCKAPSGRIFVDGKGIGDVEDLVLRDRRKLSYDGIVLVLVSVNRESGEVMPGLDIITKGFVIEEESRDFIDDAKCVLLEVIKNLDDEVIRDMPMLQARIRSKLKKFIYKSMERRPVIVPFVMET